jgi:hypothetical protein
MRPLTEFLQRESELFFETFAKSKIEGERREEPGGSVRG